MLWTVTKFMYKSEYVETMCAHFPHPGIIQFQRSFLMPWHKFDGIIKDLNIMCFR